MSGTQRPGKEVTTSSQRKRVRSGGNVPPAPAVPRGQTTRFELRAVVKKGKVWWKKHTEANYFSDVRIDMDSLAREFPRIMRRIQEFQMGFIFDELTECNLHIVWEFCVNWATESRSNFVKVRGVDVNLTPAVLNDIVGTSPDAVSLVLTGLNIRPPYRAIRHTLCGPQSMVQWTKHNAKRYHQSLPYAHMLREAWVWLNIVMHCSTPGLHYTNITRDRVCLIYYLMTPSELNISVVKKSAMRKDRAHVHIWRYHY